MNADLDEPRTPQFVYNDEFVDNFEKNEEFLNIDNDEEFVDIEEDDDNLDGENDDDDLGGDDVYENVDGNGVPYMNQLFHTLEDTGNLFRAYALKNGFAIKIQCTQRRTKSNEIYARLYVCRLSGKIDVGESSNPTKLRREILPKSDFKVRMYVIYRKKLSLWEITTLELNHNHGVVTPSKMNLVQCEKRVNTATKSLIKTLYGSGIHNFQVMNVIGNIHGGNNKVGDVQATLDLLYRFNEESRSQNCFSTQVDAEQRLKCLFWVDPRCLMAYENFGDVVAFDTTSRTNRYAMPFFPFTGVNHHYQSVIFGFALIRDELATTFQWILSTWLEAVGNKHQMTIITDQDQAMASGIGYVLPNSTHLLCLWNLSNKFPEKLAHYYSTFPDFKVDFDHCIYNSLTKDDFEARWETLPEKYDLQEHKWIQGLYELKEKWIIGYTDNIFSAGQNTTSMGEGMNSFFDSYVSSATGLKKLLKMLKKQWQDYSYGRKKKIM